jgi:hypothetical protein
MLIRDWRNGDYVVDYNDYWTTAACDPLFDGRDFREWRATSGQDAHSVLADPLFVDAAKRDFRLRPESPALKLGFKPIDLAGIGLYGEADWVGAPGKVARREFVLPPTAACTPTRIDDGFEDTPAGGPAKGATTLGETAEASIRASAEAAAGGRQSLKFVDAAGLGQAFYPHLYYRLRCLKGVVRGSFDVRRGEGFILRYEWRDAARPYRVGPVLQIGPSGDVLAGRQKLLTLPADTWMHVEIACGLGSDATGTYDLTLTVAGRPPQRFEKLPCGSKDFSRLEWLGFTSLANQKATLYLDNVQLLPAAEAKKRL